MDQSALAGSSHPRNIEDLEFLLEAAAQLGEPMDELELLQRLTRLAIPRLADLCTVEIATPDGGSEQVAATALHVEGAPTSSWRRPAASRHPSLRVLRSFVPMLLPEVSALGLASVVDGAPTSDPLARLTPSSLMIFPLSDALPAGRPGPDQLRAVLVMARVSGRNRHTAEDFRLGQALCQHAARALRIARRHQRARGALERRDELLTLVSHDLRNALNAVVIATRLLFRAYPNDENLHGRVRSIERSAERMRGLLGNLVDASHLDSGNLNLRRAAEDLAALVADVMEELEPLAQSRSLELRREHPEGPVEVECDRQRIEQVVTNLLGNAIKFSPAGKDIRVRVGADDVRALCSVIDQGRGIDPAEQPHIFSRFWQGKASTEGSGLGLYICRGIIEGHGGTLTVESTPGLGSTFTFTLPLTRSLPVPRGSRGEIEQVSVETTHTICIERTPEGTWEAWVREEAGYRATAHSVDEARQRILDRLEPGARVIDEIHRT